MPAPRGAPRTEFIEVAGCPTNLPELNMSAAEIDRPIFILGPPRSGTTLLYETLARHPDVGYLHLGFKRFPGVPRLGQALVRARIYPDQPKEAREFWNRFATREDDAMDAADATPEVVAWYRLAVAGLLRAQGATRFVAKLPALSLRARWLDAVFPGCHFVVA